MSEQRLPSQAPDAAGGVFSRASATYNTVGPRHFDYFARRLVDRAGIRPNDFVLDAATGTGAVLASAAPSDGVATPKY